MERSAVVKLGEKNIVLRMNFASLIRLKRETGVDLLQQGHAARLTEVDVLPAALWAFSDAEQIGMSVMDVAEAMRVEEVTAYIEAIRGLIEPDPSSPSDQDEAAVEAATP